MSTVQTSKLSIDLLQEDIVTQPSCAIECYTTCMHDDNYIAFELAISFSWLLEIIFFTNTLLHN